MRIERQWEPDSEAMLSALTILLAQPTGAPTDDHLGTDPTDSESTRGGERNARRHDITVTDVALVDQVE